MSPRASVGSERKRGVSRAGVGVDRRPRNVTSLVALGSRFIAAAVRGRAPALGVSAGDFTRGLVRAVRLHFFAFPAAAALAGSASVPTSGVTWRVVLATLGVALAWGVGQLLNDALDVEADAVDAPDRPFVSGLLPEAPTAAVGLSLGLVVTLALASVHRAGFLLVAACALLLFVYGRAKGIAGLGNVTHGLLMAVIAFIGAAATEPSAPLADVLGHVWRSSLLVFAIAALYLQANYEKDRVGDRRAGYQTLALVLGVRASAVSRACVGIALAYGAHRLGALPSATSLALMGLALALLLVSAAIAFFDGRERGALTGYRFAVHSTLAALVALAEPRLGAPAAVISFLAAAALVERAFRLMRNP